MIGEEQHLFECCEELKSYRDSVDPIPTFKSADAIYEEMIKRTSPYKDLTDDAKVFAAMHAHK